MSVKKTVTRRECACVIAETCGSKAHAARFPDDKSINPSWRCAPEEALTTSAQTRALRATLRCLNERVPACAVRVADLLRLHHHKRPAGELVAGNISSLALLQSSAWRTGSKRRARGPDARTPSGRIGWSSLRAAGLTAWRQRTVTRASLASRARRDRLPTPPRRPPAGNRLRRGRECMLARIPPAPSAVRIAASAYRNPGPGSVRKLTRAQWQLVRPTGPEQMSDRVRAHSVPA